MGYAKGSQKSNGIHLRQFSRAYVVAEKNNGNRVVFVSVDACMISTLVKMQVSLNHRNSVYIIFHHVTDCLYIHTH